MATDLLELTAALVDIPSVSHHEQEITDWIEAELDAVPWLEVDRVGDNLVARTQLGRGRRVLLGGHTDTVPANDNETARIVGDEVWGLGAADMKGGLAVMLDLARSVDDPAVDVTYLFYAREEVAVAHNGLRELFGERPDLLEADAALLGEPTASSVEAGCQGVLRVRLTMAGERAHTARAWLGRNAVHRLGRVLAVIDDYEPRRPEIDGCHYRESVQAVHVTGGVAGNVVPDEAEVLLSHRFAPDRTIDEAEAHLRELLAPVTDEGDTFEIVDAAPAAPPSLNHPLLAALIDRNGLDVEAKLAWTDVAFFASHGVPAANFGPGEPTLAHAAEERVSRTNLDAARAALADLVTRGAD